MVIVVAAIMGWLAGAMLGQWSNAVLGAAIGALVAAISQQNQKLFILDRDLKQVRASIASVRDELGAGAELEAAEQATTEATSRTAPQPSAHTSSSVIEPSVKPITAAKRPAQQADTQSSATAPSPNADRPESETRQQRESASAWTNNAARDHSTNAGIKWAVSWLKRFFTTGNVVVKVGIIVLFFGLGFLLRYAAERAVFPIELRLAAVAFVAIAMLLIGWRLRLKNAAYALVMQGGAVAVLYLTVFSSARYYAVLPLGLAFVIMLALVAFSCYLALRQDSKSLAIFATAGGFLAPILASSDSGSHVALFTYYGFLNAGIVAIAWYKSWRILNWLGFVFTFIIASLWGHDAYRPEFFASTEPFLVLFFGFYVAIPILFAHRQPPELKGVVDGSLVFGVPLVGFTLQSALVVDFEYGQAMSALLIAALYISLARILWHKQLEGMRLLTESFLALGVIFASLAVPFALDGQWTAMTWALEGAGIVWVGIRQQRLSARCFGMLLQVCAAGALLLTAVNQANTTAVLNSSCIGSILISLAGLFTSFQYFRHHRDLTRQEYNVDAPLLAWGGAWWLGAGLLEIDRYVGAPRQLDMSLLFIALSLLCASWLSRRLHWTRLGQASILLLPVMAVMAIFGYIDAAWSNLLSQYGFLVWGSAFVIQFVLLRRGAGLWHDRVLQYWHAGSLYVLLFIVSWSLSLAVAGAVAGSSLWAAVIWGAIPTIAVLALHYISRRYSIWPLGDFPSSYLGAGLLPVVAFLAVWIVRACLYSGDAAPLSYFPVLNPADVTQLSAMMAIYIWLRYVQQDAAWPLDTRSVKSLSMMLAALGFVWLNCAVARTVHAYGDVSYALGSLFDSAIFQTSITIVWTLTAFGAMGFASRIGHRTTWYAGAGLLAIVVLKLFIIDLADTGTVTRIVSFISVGLLMLLIGYITPIPPAETKPKQQALS